MFFDKVIPYRHDQFNGVQPEFRVSPAGFDVNMPRLGSLVTEEKEPVTSGSQYRRHRLARPPVPAKMDAERHLRFSLDLEE